MPPKGNSLAQPGDIGAALGLMTVLPAIPSLSGPGLSGPGLSGPGPGGADRGARAAWAWPLAGIAVALVAGLAGWLLTVIGMGPGLVAAGVLAAQALVTGALHEDGLADSADGLFGGQSPARRLEIMKDSHIGSFGTLALLIVTLARWSALSTLIGAGELLAPLLGAALLSRATLPLIMVALPPARPGGLAGSLGTPPRATAALGLILALTLALFALGWALIPAAAAAGVMAVLVAVLAMERVGGQTGDILGAAQVLSELAVLAALCAAL